MKNKLRKLCPYATSALLFIANAVHGQGEAQSGDSANQPDKNIFRTRSIKASDFEKSLIPSMEEDKNRYPRSTASSSRRDAKDQSWDDWSDWTNY